MRFLTRLKHQFALIFFPSAFTELRYLCDDLTFFDSAFIRNLKIQVVLETNRDGKRVITIVYIWPGTNKVRFDLVGEPSDVRFGNFFDNVVDVVSEYTEDDTLNRGRAPIPFMVSVDADGTMDFYNPLAATRH